MNEPFAIDCPDGAPFFTWSGLTQKLLIPYADICHARLKQTVACATSSKLNGNNSSFSAFSKKNGEPWTSAWKTLSFFSKYFLIIALFDELSLPPTAKIPSDVKNHLYLSYQLFFLISLNPTEPFAISPFSIVFSNFSSVFFINFSIDFTAPFCFFDSSNNFEAIVGSEESGSILIFDSLIFM